MNEPIWRNHLFKPIHYRVLWWMIAMGAGEGALMRGWMNECSDELGVHRITLNRVVRRLIERGFVRALKKGSHALVDEAFAFEDNPRVRVLKRGGEDA